MSERTPMTPEQIETLLALRATEGLDAQDQAVYDQRVADNPAIGLEAEAFELAAAAAEIALRSSAESAQPMPNALRDRIVTEARKRLTEDQPAPLKLAQAPAPADTKPTPLFFFSRAAIGWYAAAAAVIALMVVFSRNLPDPIDNTTPEDRYAALQADPATVSASWSFNAGDGDPRYANATGEVIFNADTQTGYMRLTGLPVNDPSAEQYQLWIVDASRSGTENTDRVDGGVFDITAQGEVIIPIDAKIDARQPVFFAITVETPGGVVESKGPLQVVAAVE